MTQSANLSLREKKRKAKQDPYRWAQAQQRKNANLERRNELQKERNEGLGDVVFGRTTPFVESLDSAGQARTSGEAKVDAAGQPLEAAQELPTSIGLRNHYVTDEELDEATKDAFALTKPAVGVVEGQMDASSEERKLQHTQNHAKVVEALRRITSLENSSARDRFHVNVSRIVDELGRHNTDGVLKPKPKSISPNTIEMAPRAGPDTGSSEVQIGILTAKIRNLAQTLSVNRGYKDKHNKRNLRVLLHKRQRLLRYMNRKERGSERWTNMVQKLGITPAMWQGQVDL